MIAELAAWSAIIGCGILALIWHELRRVDQALRAQAEQARMAADLAARQAAAQRFRITPG